MRVHLAQREKVGVADASHIGCPPVPHLAAGMNNCKNKSFKRFLEGGETFTPAGNVEDADLAKDNSLSESDKNLMEQSCKSNPIRYK